MYTASADDETYTDPASQAFNHPLVGRRSGDLLCPLLLGPGTTGYVKGFIRAYHCGVQREVKARFQLFGETVSKLTPICWIVENVVVNGKFVPIANPKVNTASRIESSSLPNKIQVSQKTAELVVEAGKVTFL
jgi:hypothetical protein